MATREYSVPFGRDRASAIYTDAMSKMYGLVALGVIVTAAAIWVGDQIGVGEFIFSFGWVGMLVMLGALMGVIFGASSAAARGRIGLATVLYFGFTGLAGLYLSPILLTYTGDTIGVAFLLTGGSFVGMSVIGMTTKRDLSKLGPMLLIGIVGVIVISLINVILIQSSGLFLLINIVLLPLFLLLTVWETKQMKELAQEAAMRGDERAATQVAVMGSIGLYVNVLNLFVIILNLLGFMSDD
jgi:FtsH-binding integral membrane protein